MNVVVTHELVKRYGKVVALDGLNLQIPKGSVCAIIGPNGSGKTTAFGLLAGLLIPDLGSVDLFGEGPFDARRHAGRVSLMPQDSLPSPHASVRQSLRYYAELQGMDAAAARREADHWLARVHLSDRANAKQSQLSHGMRRRFSVAQAFLGRPELILLDEPTAGLDPELVAEMRGLFSERRGQATVLISSHVLSELEGLCDHAVFVDRGRIVRQGSMQSVLQADTLVRVTLGGAPDLARLAEQVTSATFEWNAPVLSVRFAVSTPPAAANARILRALLDQEVGILSLEAGQSLEASYLATRQRPGAAQRAIQS
jgi:ABC-2 type transport system ATP-binding protein